MKTLTASLNATKTEMDRTQSRLQQKQDEKRAAAARAGRDELEEEEEGLVIDEEELMLLREMKDMKRAYREDYERLRAAKGAIADAQANIDGTKQQIVVAFEQWHAEEFEDGGQEEPLNLHGAAGAQAAEELPDEEADAYLSAKRNVDTLHRAKKLEKMRPGQHKK